MADKPVSLTSTGPVPASDQVSPGDKVVFTNNMTVSTQLTLPQCFAGNPTSPVTIAAGASSPQYNVNGNPNGSPYSYSYTSDSDTATDKGGTIDVS